MRMVWPNLYEVCNNNALNRKLTACRLNFCFLLYARSARKHDNQTITHRDKRRRKRLLLLDQSYHRSQQRNEVKSDARENRVASVFIDISFPNEYMRPYLGRIKV
jgi:hypothetical protein